MKEQKYVVLDAGYRKILESMVNRAINNGYIPIGGICVSVMGKTNIARNFYQAMLKK